MPVIRGKRSKLGRCLRYFPKGDVRMYPHDHAPDRIRNSLGGDLQSVTANETLSSMYLNGPFWALYWHLQAPFYEENHAQ